MLNEKMGNLGAEKVKKHGFDWQQGYGGGALVKAPKEKWGKVGEMGKPNQSTLAPHFLLYAPSSPHNTPFPPISPYFPLISPISHSLSPIFLGTGYITGTLLGIYPPTSSGYF